MTACGDVQLLLGPFEDGELRPREMEDVAFHVVGCDVCRAALEDYRSLGAALRRTMVEPALDGFTRAVMTRIEYYRPPLRMRLPELWEPLGRFGAVIQVAGVAAVSALLTLMVIGPRVKDGLRRSVPIAMAKATHATEPARFAEPAAGSQLAENQGPLDRPASVIMANTDPDPSGESDEAAAVAARDSQELVSALGGGSGPSVAVWDEPRTGTTVVWVPDQQP